MQFLSSFWDFFQYQFLGMQWLNKLVGKMLTAFGMPADNPLTGSLQFFIYDTIKIFILLCSLIFVISYIQSYFPPEKTKQILSRFKGISANILGALLGTVTPFCSCSSIPLFIGFSSAGVPIGVSFSFLISSPLVDLGAFILLTSIFGGKIAVVYVVVGLILAVFGGMLIDKLKMTDQIEDYIRTAPNNIDITLPDLTKKDRALYAKTQMQQTFKKVFPYVLIGVGIGSIIHNWIPQSFVENLLGSGNPFSVLLATVIGIPMYADIFGSIPIAEALYYKGAGIGTILSFMMAVTALSLPSVIMLRNAIKPKLLATFVAIVGIGIIIIGYFFNFTQFLF